MGCVLLFHPAKPRSDVMSRCRTIGIGSMSLRLPSLTSIAEQNSANTSFLNPEAYCVLPAEPAVFPAYIRPTKWRNAHFLVASMLASRSHCVPAQKGRSPAGAWVVLQSCLRSET